MNGLGKIYRIGRNTCRGSERPAGRAREQAPGTALKRPVKVQSTRGSFAAQATPIAGDGGGVGLYGFDQAAAGPVGILQVRPGAEHGAAVFGKEHRALCELAVDLAAALQRPGAVGGFKR